MSEEKVITLGSSKTVDHLIVQQAKLKKHKLWADEDIVKEEIKFYILMPQGYGLTSFCSEPGKKVLITSLWCYSKDCKIFEMK
jgi:hypothetical protein